MKNKPIVSELSRFVLILFLFCCVAGVNSCKKEKKTYETILCDLKSMNQNPKVEIKSITKLETSDSCLIGEITKIIFYNDRFFILDRMRSKSLYVFDNNGKFITKTRRGKGPSECLNPMDFMVDTIDQTIQLWDQATYKMLKYDINLRYIQSKSFNNVSLVNAEYINRDTMLVFAQVATSYNVNTNQNLTYANYCIYANNLKKSVNKLIPISDKLIGLSLDAPICKTNRILFLAPFDNNIYGIEKNEARIIYKLDFGKLNVTNEDVKRGITYVFNSARNGSKITSVDNLHENNQYLSFTFYYNNKMNFIIHSKKTNKNYNSESIFNKKELPSCKLKGINGDNFLAISEPDEINNFEYTDTNTKKQSVYTTDFDNPIIILFSISE